MQKKRSCLKQSDPSGEISMLNGSLPLLSKKEVSFHNVEILEFAITVGDNPSCRSGAPIALGNMIENRSQYDIDVYENFVHPLSEKSFSKAKLTLSVPERANLLLSNGYSIEDIVAATVATDKIQKQRVETFRNMKRDEFGSFLGSVANWVISPISSAAKSSSTKKTEELILSPKTTRKIYSFSAKSA